MKEGLSVVPASVYGRTLTCRGWQQEGILRLLLNTLDRDVAENPDEMLVYGSGRAVRDRRSLVGLVETLRSLGNDETLVVQSGKPVAVFKTWPEAPRVLNSYSMVVPAWATWPEFWRLERMGLTMYGQCTAGAWACIGTQGVLEGTMATFGMVAKQHFGGTLVGRWVLTSGLGVMGRAQPLAICANGGACLVVEVNPRVVEKRISENYVDFATDSLDEALRMVREACEQRSSIAVALVGNAADVYPAVVERGVTPDVVTDQTSAHDLLNGYVPRGLTVEEAERLRREAPDEYVRRAEASLIRHFGAMLTMRSRGAVVFDYGNNIRGQAYSLGIGNAFSIPGFIQQYLRPLFCEGRGPFRWIALSGEPEDIFAIDDVVLREFRNDFVVTSWIEFARRNVWFHGLPARVCWLDPLERSRLGEIVNRMVGSGQLKAPVAFTRCSLDGGAVASPYRETEGMVDGSDVIADWPILNALLCTSSGASMVSVGQGGGVGVAYSVHAGMTVVADGTPELAERVARVLLSDPGLGVVRYADAGYLEAENAWRQLPIKAVPSAGGCQRGLGEQNVGGTAGEPRGL